MSSGNLPAIPSGNAPHGADICFWRNEKAYVMSHLQDLSDKLSRLEGKIDVFVQIATEAKVQGGEVGEIRKSLNLSREEIAALKVKASLLGIAAAAFLEIVFLIVKQFKA